MGDAKAGSRSTRAGTKRTSLRRRAVGTRDRIISHLAADGEVIDPTGMASTRLAEAVGYPGSSVAFAQLLSGMERDGLIVREVRGKRTYRITLPTGVMATPAPGAGDGTHLPAAGAGTPGKALASTGPTGSGLSAAALGRTPAGATGFDYDELARRLLVQVVRRLAAPSVHDLADDVATVDAQGALAETVGTLTAENARLRKQLREAQRDLARERTRRAPITSELNQAEVVVLERLVSAEGTDDRSDAAAH